MDIPHELLILFGETLPLLKRYKSRPIKFHIDCVHHFPRQIDPLEDLPIAIFWRLRTI